MSTQKRAPAAGQDKAATSPGGMKQIAIRVPVDILEAVDEIVSERYGQTDRTAVMRELMAEALKARGKLR